MWSRSAGETTSRRPCSITDNIYGGGGGKLGLKSKSCESASPPILHILVSLATPVVVNGSWGNLGPLRIIVLNLVIKAFAFDYADSILARRNRLFEEDYE